MKVFCPDCGTQIAAEDVNLQTLLARCRKCDNVFSIADAAQAESGHALNRIPGRKSGKTLPRPPRIRVEETATGWIASWRWFSSVAISMVFFCIVWDGFLVFWYSLAFTQHGPWLAIVFPILHVAVGVALTYGTLATFFNSTRIAANPSELSVQSGPLPWIGNRVLPALSVRKVFTRIGVTNENSNGNHRRTFSLFAVLDTGRTVRLAGGLNDAEEAGFLQEQLEQRLNLRPSPLPVEA